MLKPTVFIKIAVCFSSLFLLIVGCGQESGAPEKTGTVVSKKITSADTGKQSPAQATQAAQPETAAPQPAAVAAPAPPQYVPELAVGYDPKGRIDPFIPLIREEPEKAAKEAEGVAVGGKGKKREKRVPQTPLEKIDLNQLSLRAIILAPSGNRALVEESTGKGYIITKGTYIGRNEGVVTQILKDKVMVEETVESIQGEIVTQEKELKLPKPPGE